MNESRQAPVARGSVCLWQERPGLCGFKKAPKKYLLRVKTEMKGPPSPVWDTVWLSRDGAFMPNRWGFKSPCWGPLSSTGAGASNIVSFEAGEPSKGQIMEDLPGTLWSYQQGSDVGLHGRKSTARGSQHARRCRTNAGDRRWTLNRSSDRGEGVRGAVGTWTFPEDKGPGPLCKSDETQRLLPRIKVNKI